MRSHWQPATMLPKRNLGAGSEISESNLVPTRSKCRFRIGTSWVVPIIGRTNIRVLPKGATIGVLVPTLSEVRLIWKE
ncbi:hypothetical protein Taro_018584 [Colocasia esculenta]|uniref:Uncharacterized protein n=1 Tax=Colocasia esculenta TaxID=4460 RepID=A0A843UU83_COLES|nr:hypothetical protein [Colocasia esculenta]